MHILRPGEVLCEQTGEWAGPTAWVSHATGSPWVFDCLFSVLALAFYDHVTEVAWLQALQQRPKHLGLCVPRFPRGPGRQNVGTAWNGLSDICRSSLWPSELAEVRNRLCCLCISTSNTTRCSACGAYLAERMRESRGGTAYKLLEALTKEMP